MAILLELQRFFLPGLFTLLAWAVWRAAFCRDLAVGLVLYLGLVIIVDGFLNTAIYLPGLAVGSIRYSEVCALFLLANRPPLSDRHSPPRLIYWLIGLYFILLFLAALRGDSVKEGIFDFRRIIIPQLVALLVAVRGLGSAGQYRRFYLCLTSLVIIIGLFIFWDVFFDRLLLKSDMLHTPQYYVNRKHGRFGSFFLNPNTLGAFVVLVFPLAFVYTLRERQLWCRAFGWLGLLALVFCLAETQSRGPVLALGAVMLLLTVGPVYGISRSRRLGFLVLFLLSFTLFMPGFYQRATERFNSIEKETTSEEASRSTLWKYSWDIVVDNPISGIGFGEDQFLEILESRGFAERYGRLFDNPHHSYLQMAIYAGLPTLAAFLLANLILLVKAARIFLSRRARGDVTTLFGLSIGIVGFLATCYTDMHLFAQSVAPIFWINFGLLLALVSKPETAGN